MKYSIRETYKDFSAFLKRPADRQDSVQTWQHKTKRLFSLLAIDIPIMIIIMAVIHGIENLGLFSLEDHKLNLLIQQLPIWMIMLFGIVIVPFIEELVFRLYLRFNHNFLVRLIILFASLTGRQNKIKIETYLKNLWKAIFSVIFYFSALIFGIVHLVNFEFTISILFLFPVLIAPQFIMGLFLGYLRVKYSFVLGFLMHAIHNAVFIVASLIFMGGSIEKLNIQTHDYLLLVNESNIREKTYSFKHTDSINFNGTSMKSILAYLLDKDENLIESNNNQMIDKKINLKFKNYLNDSINPKKVILYHLLQVYDFNVESNKKYSEVLELQIVDSLLLVKNKSNVIGNSSNTTITLKEIKIENINLSQLAQTLTSNFNKYIICSSNSHDKYDFIFPKGDFNELSNLLHSQYGLILYKSEKELEYIQINFSKAK